MYGEGFIVTMTLIVMAGLVFIAACFADPGNQLVLTIVGVMGATLAAVVNNWLPTRGQTSMP